MAQLLKSDAILLLRIYLHYRLLNILLDFLVMDAHRCLRRLEGISWVINRLKVGFWMGSRIVHVTTCWGSIDWSWAGIFALWSTAKRIIRSLRWIHVSFFGTLHRRVLDALDSRWLQELALHLEFVDLKASARFVERTLGRISLRELSEARTSLRRLKIFPNNMSGIKRGQLFAPRVPICYRVDGALVLTIDFLFT